MVFCDRDGLRDGHQCRTPNMGTMSIGHGVFDEFMSSEDSNLICCIFCGLILGSIQHSSFFWASCVPPQVSQSVSQPISQLFKTTQLVHTCPIAFLSFKLPAPPCAVLLVLYYHLTCNQYTRCHCYRRRCITIVTCY